MKFRKFIQEVWKFIRWQIKNMRRETKKIIAFSLVAAIVGGFCGGYICKTIEEKQAEKELARITTQLKKEEEAKVQALEEKIKKIQNVEEKEIPWYLTLVNFENPLQEGYVPKLKELKDDYRVDERIIDAASKMLKDAKDDGMKILICSAYRSVERQEQVFNESLQDRLDLGMDYWEAFEDNRLSVAEPGTSEHALGLALDLISNDYTELDKGQETTKEAQWLKENCHKYGFILRYPPEKTEITGIIYEPWHYRYVGVEDATKIKSLGVTLEEYLETYY